MNKGILPVEVISFCDSKGNLKPLRLRYEDIHHDQHVIRKIKVLDIKELHYVGLLVYSFTCTAPFHLGELKFELRYHVMDHQWILFRIIS